MRNAEETPADGFPRVAGPAARRHPGDGRPGRTAAPRPPHLAGPPPPPPASPRHAAPPGAPAATAAVPGTARPAPAGPRSPGPRPATVRPGEPLPGRLQRRAAPAAAAAVRAAPAAAGPSRRPGQALLPQLPYLVVLACAVAGIWWAWSGSPDVGNGAGVVGGGLLAAAIARLALPPHAVGLLASRRRLADVLALGILGAGLLVLAFVLPPT